MLRFIKTQPVFLFGLLELIVGALIAAEVIEPQLGGALGAIFAFIAAAPKMGVVWNAVTPVVKAAEQATQVATEVVTQLEGTTVGAVGAVTGEAQDLIESTVKEVLG